MTDSPAGNYNSVPPGQVLTRTTAITSAVFSLAKNDCPKPILSFQHDFVIARVGDSRDVGRVEISTNGGATWTRLASYSGGGIFGSEPRAVNSQEWRDVAWRQAKFDLSPYAGSKKVRLRFSLEVDQTVSDKGWVIDQVLVTAGAKPITLPVITGFTPSVITNNLASTLRISGSNFLSPAQVVLQGPARFTLPAQSTQPTLIRVLIPAGLPPAEYHLQVINGNGKTAQASNNLLILAPNTCFYDFFTGGTNKWLRSGQWDLVTIRNSDKTTAWAMTDSPSGNYQGAPLGQDLTWTTAITSAPFSLAPASCRNPVLTFGHDFVIPEADANQDVGLLEISTDDGATWTKLAQYRSEEAAGLAPQALKSPEWQNVAWRQAQFDLSAYAGSQNVRLRFSLKVDQAISGKGWVIDHVLVTAGPPEATTMFLPVLFRK
jgi:hypothetical protein